MSRSFLVESLLTKDACHSNSSNSKHLTISDAVTVTQLTTHVGLQNDKLKASMTSRKELLNTPADTHVVADRQMLQRNHKLSPYHCIQSPQLATAAAAAAAVDAYLQSLKSVMRATPPPRVRQMIAGGCFAESRCIYDDVPQSLKPASLCRQQLDYHHDHHDLYHHHHQQQQRQCRVHLYGGSLTPVVAASHGQHWPVTPKAEIAGVGGSPFDDNQSKMADASCVTGSTINKRMRTAFTSRQLVELEREFVANTYLSRLRRIEMSSRLQLSEKQIKIWYQNRRVRHKKESMTQDTGDVCRHDDVTGSESRHCACAPRTSCRRDRNQRQMTASKS